MDQIELKRGEDHRAIAVDPADPKAAFASARTVIDEWERTPASTEATEALAAADARVSAAEEALAQANKAKDDLSARYNTGDNSVKGSKTKRTGNQSKKKAPAKKKKGR